MSEEEKKNEGATVDMYHVKSHWSVVLLIAFTVAFLIFAIVAFLSGQVI